MKCPNKDCPKFGKQCFWHCQYCGADILWKPKGMDFNVKYTGPKPLNPGDGSKHSCREKEEAVKEEERGTGRLLAYFLHHGYPRLQAHYTRCFQRKVGIQQECGDPECLCARVK